MGLNHNQFQELTLLDLEMLSLLEQFESQSKRDEYRSQQSIYNEHKKDLCSLCGSPIPFQTEMCQNCAQILEDSFRSQPRNDNILHYPNGNPPLNDNNLNHPDKLQSRNQILQEGNNCASCSKKLPFNKQTFGWEEVCDECQKKNDNAEPIKNQLANKNEDSLHLNPNKPLDDNIKSDTNKCRNFCSIL